MVGKGGGDAYQERTALVAVASGIFDRGAFLGFGGFVVAVCAIVLGGADFEGAVCFSGVNGWNGGCEEEEGEGEDVVDGGWHCCVWLCSVNSRNGKLGR